MGKMDEAKSVLLDSSITRRSFMKGLIAVGGGLGMVTGCSQEDNTVFTPSNKPSNGGDLSGSDFANPSVYYSSCVHNCGTGIRCVSKLHVVNGRIVRVTSDDSDYAFDGSYRNKEQYNDSRSLTCPKGRAIKYRAHHPAKLRYALKQTKQRGDVTGFVRIPVEQALKEIATKYRKTVEKYGPGAVHNIYGTSGGYGGQGTYAKYASTRSALTPLGSRGGYGDYSYFQYHFGSVIVGHPGSWGAYNKPSNLAWQFPAIAGVVKNVVSWGANMLTTVNSAAWGYIRSFEKLKERGGRAWFIGPEFTDTGVTCHTDWIQTRNYTDVALIMAMFYEMIVNTFNEDGSLKPKSSKSLDIDYIDTMVHGFFASPEYWVHTTTGEIVLQDPKDTKNTYRHIAEVKEGECLAAYIMGNDKRLTKANYNNAKNYTAKKYGNKARAGLVSWAIKKGDQTEYLYKKDMKKPKTPEWASAICGVPAEKIRELANMYTDENQHPIFNEWAGGTQKQHNGSIQLWAITALMAVTKTFGLSGETFGGAWAGISSHGPVDDKNKENYIDFSGVKVGNANVSDDIPRYTKKDFDDGTIKDKDLIGTYKTFEPEPSISCKEWFNGIKLAFKDELTPANGYDGSHIPDWDMKNRYYSNHGGVKSMVVFERDAQGKLQIAPQTKCYKYKKGSDGSSPIYAGIRMIINSGGAIMVNQHMNSNDLTAMYKAIPALNSSKVADTFNNPDALCLVTFDLFMSPTARYMDYVLPAVSQLEAVGVESFGGHASEFDDEKPKSMYRPPVVKPLGDALDGWEMTYKAWEQQSKLGEASYGADAGSVLTVTTTGITNAATNYLGGKPKFQPIADYYEEVIDKAIKSGKGKFAGKSKNYVYANQFTPTKNNDEYICTAFYETRGTTTNFFNKDSSIKDGERDKISKTGQIRKNLDDYLKGAMDKPFVFTSLNGVQNKFDAKTNVPFPVDTKAADYPQMSGKFQIYNARVKYDYENAFKMYHGWLPEEKRGQENKDAEGDLLVYPIPMYFNFEDSFKESYNGFEKVDSATGEAKRGKNADFFATGKPLTMSTTHDRFRVHSTHDENPLLRELNHRVVGGGWQSGNDWKEYAVFPAGDTPLNQAPYKKGQMISQAIEEGNKKTASWHEIWINTLDARERGIADGDLCLVENPIGKVRVIARVTDRCMKGHLNLHQGGWYDPNPKDGIDDGGNANTLIASTPSRYDHGNSQQSAYVKISKVTNFEFKK